MFTQESNRAGDIFAWQTFPLPQLVPSRAGPDLAIICLKIVFLCVITTSDFMVYLCYYLRI